MSHQWECGQVGEMVPHFLPLLISPSPIQRLPPTSPLHYLLVWGVYRKEIETFLLSMCLPQV